MTLDAAFLARALDAAHRAADAAEAITLPRFRAQDFSVETKADETPVTDRRSRAPKRRSSACCAPCFPDHAFYGEEEGREGDGDFLWLIDPIDGTKSFVRGYPMFSTQIALMHRGELVARRFERRRSTARPRGRARRRCVSRTCGGDRVASARRSATHSMRRRRSRSAMSRRLPRGPRWNALARSRAASGRTRGYGDFVHYHLLARGAIDLVVESDVNILDIAPLVRDRARGRRRVHRSRRRATSASRCRARSPVRPRFTRRRCGRSIPDPVV